LKEKGALPHYRGRAPPKEVLSQDLATADKGEDGQVVPFFQWS